MGLGSRRGLAGLCSALFASAGLGPALRRALAWACALARAWWKAWAWHSLLCCLASRGLARLGSPEPWAGPGLCSCLAWPVSGGAGLWLCCAVLGSWVGGCVGGVGGHDPAPCRFVVWPGMAMGSVQEGVHATDALAYPGGHTGGIGQPDSGEKGPHAPALFRCRSLSLSLCLYMSDAVPSSPSASASSSLLGRARLGEPLGSARGLALGARV